MDVGWMGGLFDCSTVAGLRFVVYCWWSTASRVALEVFTERSRLSSNKVRRYFCGSQACSSTYAKGCFR